MSKDTQYGCTLFIDDFTVGASKQMKRISFSKNAPEGAAYDEAWLQRLIMSHPRVLPVDQIERAFEDPIPICMELPKTSGGYLDNLLVTPRGDLALIECKLWRNPEARREVVGQIIDYAKDLSAWTYEKLQEAISRAKSLDGLNGVKPRGLYESVAAGSENDQRSLAPTTSRRSRVQRLGIA